MKIGLIGCGIIAETHAMVLKKVKPNAHLIICDVNLETAKSFAQKIKAQGGVYTNIDDLLEQERPEVIHVMTSVSSHYEVTKKALLAGCHVYLEKPLTETPDQFRELHGLAKQRNQVLAMGYSTLGMPVVMQAKQLVDSGKLGRLIAVHCDFMCAWGGNTIPEERPDHWTYTSKGGILQNMVDHPASLIVDVLDNPENLQYKYHYARRNLLPFTNPPDLLHISLQNDDQMGSLTLSLGHGNGHRIANYYLEKGTITIDMTRQLFSVIQGSGPPNIIKKTLSGITSGFAWAGGSVGNVIKVATGKLRRAPGIFSLIENFYQTIEGRSQLLVKEAIAFQMVQMLDDIWTDINNHPLQD